MSVPEKPPLLHNGLHQLSVITTDLTEAEALIRQIADAEKKACPKDFAGNTPCVYFKLPYVPPYETFKELRRLILRIRENTGLRADFRGIVAIEATQWLDHEQEEYFTVLLKYLYDHRSLWHSVLVLTDVTKAQTNRFLSCCARYISPRSFDLRVFSRQETLDSLIRLEFDRCGKAFSPDATQILSGVLMRPELKEARSLALIARTAGEIAAGSVGRKITREDVRRYLADPWSTPALMAGKPLTEERSADHAQDPLHL